MLCTVASQGVHRASMCSYVTSSCLDILRGRTPLRFQSFISHRDHRLPCVAGCNNLLTQSYAVILISSQIPRCATFLKDVHTPRRFQARSQTQYQLVSKSPDQDFDLSQNAAQDSALFCMLTVYDTFSNAISSTINWSPNCPDQCCTRSVTSLFLQKLRCQRRCVFLVMLRAQPRIQQSMCSYVTSSCRDIPRDRTPLRFQSFGSHPLFMISPPILSRRLQQLANSIL